MWNPRNVVRRDAPWRTTMLADISVWKHFCCCNWCSIIWNMEELLSNRQYSNTIYSEKVSREKKKIKAFADRWKIRFSQRKLSRIARFCHAKGHHAPQIQSRRKLSRISTKLRNSWKFSPSKVSCYTVWSCMSSSTLWLYYLPYQNKLTCIEHIHESFLLQSANSNSIGEHSHWDCSFHWCL